MKLWHLASLDAPTVAVVWAWAFAWAARVQLPAWSLLLLALIVWSAYVGDRLLDAHAGLRTPPQHNLQARHFFHWRHRRVLVPMAAAAAVAALWIVHARIPELALRQDSVVAAATLAYFSGVHSRRKLPRALQRVTDILASREFLVGVIFAAGCMLPLWSIHPAWPAAAGPIRKLLPVAASFAVVAWLNVRAITLWETEAASQGTLVLGLPIVLAALLAAAFLLPVQPRNACLLAAAALSAGLLCWLDRARDRFDALTLRAAADVVLLVPALFILPAGWMQ